MTSFQFYQAMMMTAHPSLTHILILVLILANPNITTLRPENLLSLQLAHGLRTKPSLNVYFSSTSLARAPLNST
jgi:flagellar biosynthesis protein FliR